MNSPTDFFINQPPVITTDGIRTTVDRHHSRHCLPSSTFIDVSPWRHYEVMSLRITSVVSWTRICSTHGMVDRHDEGFYKVCV